MNSTQGTPVVTVQNNTPPKTIALVGSPNSGKTLLFNALTGLRRKVANYSGVTVERVEGQVTLPNTKETWSLLDLPGLYSLTPQSDDEKVSQEVLFGKEPPDALICVVDSTNLALHLRLVLELKTLGYPMVIALNMMDLANQSGVQIDVAELSRQLGVPVCPVSAKKMTGISELLLNIAQESKTGKGPVAPQWHESTQSEIEHRIHAADEILKKCIKSQAATATHTSTLDKILLHPFLGPVILVSILALVFQAVFQWSSIPMDLIEKAVSSFGALVSANLPEGALSSLIVDGIIGGVGSVLVFLPQILVLFAFILILEDSGYLSRAAFLMDKIMGSVGLSGKSVLPLMSGFACAIPGMISARTITNRADRLTTILITPLLTCSARLPVYALLIAAFVPDRPVIGLFRLQGVVLLSLYVAGIVAALLVALILRKTAIKGDASSLAMELPTYKWPSFKAVGRGLYDRGFAFLKKAGTFILAISIIMWFISTYPKAPEGASLPAISYSIAGKLGHLIEPILAPLGFPWQVAVAMIPGFAAREVLVGALGTVYAVENTSEEAAAQGLGAIISSQWSLATALALLAWYVFAPQCLATFAVMQKETRSWKWTAASFIGCLVMAYGAAFAVHQAAVHWSWSWN